jgi:hypothetical protein
MMSLKGNLVAVKVKLSLCRIKHYTMKMYGEWRYSSTHTLSPHYMEVTLSKGCDLDVVRGPSTPHDPESDAGGSLSSWQGHPSP